MNVSFVLNAKKVDVLISAEDSLLEVLRGLGETSAKCGCLKGVCGACTVLLDDVPVPSCQLKASMVRGRSVVTLSHFFSTDAYMDIKHGFEQAGIHLCGYCDAGKIFLAYGILKGYPIPEIKDLEDETRGYVPCCVDRASLYEGIMYAVANSHARFASHNLRKRR